MRKVVVALILTLLWASSADAQFRLRKKPQVAAPAATIAIQVPTEQTTFAAATTPLTLSGITTGINVAEVTWVNDRGGSGTATGTGTWNITAGGGSVTVFSDTFACATTTDLVSNSPQIGTGWTEAVDSAGTNAINCRTTGYTQPLASATNQRVIYTATPSPAITGTNYDYSGVWSAFGSANDASALIYSYADASNYCGVKMYYTTASTDLVWFKYVAGVNTTIYSGNVGTLPGDIVLIEVRGSSQRVLVNGVEKATTTDTFCDNTNTLGLGYGAVNGVATDNITTSSRINAVTAVDQDGSDGGVALLSGTNIITVTAKNAAGTTLATDVLRVEYGVDTTAPVCVIHTPTLNPADATATAAYSVAATCTDNLGVTAGTFTCTAASGTCTSASGSLDGTFGAAVTSVEASKSFTLSCGAAPGVLNTITFTPADAAANTPVSDSIGVTCTSADVTAPSITIQTDCGSGAGANCAISSATQSLDGIASDAGSGLASVSCACPTCSPTTVVPSGLSPWSLVLNVAQGANVVTCTATDNAGNDATATITITRSVALSADTAVLPTATVGQAYNHCLVASGGTAPYTWTKVSGTYPTGLSLSSGCITGTPGVGTDGSYTNHVYRATDSASPTPATDDTAALTLTVNVAGTGPHDYFEAIIQRSDFFKAYSFRPTAATCTTTHLGVSFASGTIANGTCNPYTSTQLTGNLSSGTGYRNGSGGLQFAEQAFVTYDYAGDTDAHKQDAAKFSLPLWIRDPAALALSSGMASSTSGAVEVITVNAVVDLGTYANTRGIGIESEVLVCQGLVGFDSTRPTINACARVNGSTTELRVLRGASGTTAAAHAGGTAVQRSAPGNIATTAQVRLPLKTVDGHSYFFVWDQYYTDSYVGITPPNLGNKMFQFTMANAAERLLETRFDYQGAIGGTTTCTGWDKATMAGAVSYRIYNAGAGVADWTQTDGNKWGPNVTDNQPLLPMVGTFCIKPNRWTRYYFLLNQVANDYDTWTAWVGDETSTPVKIIDGLQTSLSATGDTINNRFWFEFNDSAVAYIGGAAPNFQPFRNLVGYIRNFAVVQDPPSGDYATPGSGLLAKPLP
jgi:hypothetical protein